MRSNQITNYKQEWNLLFLKTPSLFKKLSCLYTWNKPKLNVVTKANWNQLKLLKRKQFFKFSNFSPNPSQRKKTVKLFPFHLAIRKQNTNSHKKSWKKKFHKKKKFFRKNKFYLNGACLTLCVKLSNQSIIYLQNYVLRPPKTFLGWLK